MTTVAVIDYGMGNIRSVSKALAHVAPSVTVQISREPEVICRADHIVFPGVGALRDCMAEIQRLELQQAIMQCAASKPFLGICLGMQALLDYSEENNGVQGLGLVPGEVKRFTPQTGLKIPHMGWNQVHQTQPHPLWQGIAQDSRFYFVHSYYVVPESEPYTMALTEYGQPFVAALGRGNLFAVQFHPEKSQQMGLQLLQNFLAWDGSV